MSAENPASGETAFAVEPSGSFWLRRSWILSLITFVALLALWEGVTRFFRIPKFIIPPPRDVVEALLSGLGLTSSVNGTFWYHIGVTAFEALLGALIGCVSGLVTGMAVAHWKLLERVAYPYIIAFQALPKIAVAPLFVIWFGFGLEAKVLITAIITFFPLLVNSIAGYQSVDPDRIDLARSCGASEFDVFRKIIVPSALPFIFAGLHMAAVLALLGALVGEYVGAQAGLGMLLVQYNNMMEIGNVFALLIVLGLFGYLLNMTVTFFERRFCFWAQRPKRTYGQQ